MKTSKMLHFADRKHWRDWLMKNHDKETEVWLVYYKGRVDVPGVSYEEAVEEALCFGWIDSIIRRIDDEKYVRKFTPRKNKSKWSDLNIRRVTNLIEEGRMTPVGLSKIHFSVADIKNSESPKIKKEKREPVVPEEIKKELMEDKKAWDFFNHLAPSYKRNYIGWIMSAKKEETRMRRLKEAVETLARNEKLGMK